MKIKNQDKIEELLEETGMFAPEELERVREYLSGKGDISVISGFALRDMSCVRSETAEEGEWLISDMVSDGNEGADKLSEVLFAAGGTSCFRMLPWGMHDRNMEILMSDPAKKAAVVAAQVGTTQWMCDDTLKPLMNMAGEDVDVLRRAAEYQYKTPLGKLAALTVYFCLKYPEAEVPGKDGAGVAPIDGADAELMREYEEVLIQNLDDLYEGRLSEEEICRIGEAVRKEEIDGAILEMVEDVCVNTPLLRTVSGTAFVNFPLSRKLQGMLKICLSSSMEETLDNMSCMDLRGYLEKGGRALDDILEIDSMEYIAWAADGGYKNILKEQFRSHREAYLKYMEGADFDIYKSMVSVVKELDPAFHKGQKDKVLSRQRKKVVDAFVEAVDAASGADVKRYLEGGEETADFMSLEGKIAYQGSRWGGSHWHLLEGYRKTYGYDSFCTRCEAALMVCRAFHNYSYLFGKSNMDKERINKIFGAVDAMGLPLRVQINAYGDMYEAFFTESDKKTFEQVVGQIFRQYLETRREEAVAAIQGTGSTGRNFGLGLLAEKPEENRQLILSFAQDSSKTVRERLLGILDGKKEWEQDVVGLLSSKKATEREIAVRVLAKWDEAAYAPVLARALEKEKNTKVRALLQDVLHLERGPVEENMPTGEELVKTLHKGNRKRGLAWAYDTPFCVVHTKQGEEAAEEYLQAILLGYSAMSPFGASAAAASLAQTLEERELALYMNELFDKWMAAGAEAKKRWVMYAASVHGGGDIIHKMCRQIQEWPKASRGAIAVEAVQALAMNPLPQALMAVDDIWRKSKYKQVKDAAGTVLESTASRLGITMEELADRIVPDLGFDENMERCFDYGARRFKVAITAALEVEVFGEDGKKLKNLPAPGKRDDATKAAAAYEEFKQMKKLMKTVVQSQKARLERALSSGRQWSVGAWKNLFVKNPIMHQFAIGLIWGIYEEGLLTASFRYMEDGSFNTEDGEEFEFPQEGQEDVTQESPKDAQGRPAALGTGRRIGIVHPMDFTEESKRAWEEQLSDYEITQPIEQLYRPVFYVDQEEQDRKKLERFGGILMNDLSLGGKMQSLGWDRGPILDAACFDCFYREDPEVSMGAVLYFSGSCIWGFNEDATIYEAKFYRLKSTAAEAGTKQEESVYEKSSEKNACLLGEVPKRYFSEIVLQLTRATASGSGRNEDWKKKSGNATS